MEQKLEFVLLSSHGDVNFSQLCDRFKISRKTGYKWLCRYQDLGQVGLKDYSRRPITSPGKTHQDIEDRIVKLRKENPEWGAKKLFKILETEKSQGSFPYTIPARSTINLILKRRGLISDERSERSQPWQRFEHEHPNDLWQMDFKGYFYLLNQKVCHPLTVMDDHSRFNLGLVACENQQYQTVKEQLIILFKTYGLPNTILADNGAPWGAAGQEERHGERCFTKLEKWLIEQQIKIIHGKPYHPQTQGKEERFHRTLKTELLQYEQFKDYTHCQQRFDWWRDKYNCYRPHEAIDFNVPANKYRPSNRKYKTVKTLPEYDTGVMVRKVTDGGIINLNGKRYRVGRAFLGDYMAVKQTTTDKEYEVYYHNQIIKKIILP